MTAVLGFLPPWLWRWVGIAALAGSAALAFYWKGVEHEAEKFEAYKAAVKAAGDKQDQLTAETIKAHKTLQELSDAEAKTASAERDAAVLRVRALQSAANRSFLPAPAAGAAGGNRVCFAADQLDRGLRATVARASERLIAIAQEGQRGVDLAVMCRDWTKGF